jgi:hypothetical protein
VDPFGSLTKMARSSEAAVDMLKAAAEELGVEPDLGDSTLAAITLCRAGRLPEEVSSSLNWREFESFCSNLLRTAGYSVRENVVLRRPRAQIDIVAAGPSHVLSIDCKHWRKDHSRSALRRIATDQKERSRLLRRFQPEAKPIVSAILSFSASSGSFVEGVAVVPLRTLRGFLVSVESYTEILHLC